MQSRVEGARWGLVAGVALALLACLPVLVARYPQMSDYPAHLARYYVMLDGGRSPWLAHWYVFAWQWTGNVGVDMLIHPFAAMFGGGAAGVEAGGRAIVALIVASTGLAILTVEWVLRRRVSAGSLFAFAFIWSPMMLIGLINFTLGLAVALFAFAAWVRLENWPWRPSLFAPLGLFVWACHLSAWGVLGIMVFGYEWSRRHDWRAFLAPWPLTLPILVLALGHGTSSEFSYGNYWWVYKEAIWIKAMRDSYYALDYSSLALVVGVLLLALIARRIDGRLGWAALLMMLLSLALPRHISGGDYVDYRMISSGLMVGCMAIDLPPAGRLGRWALILAPLLFLVRLGVTTVSWARDSAETGELLAALDRVPEGARVASAVYVPMEAWRLDHFEHIGTYALLRRQAMVNANFAVDHVHMLHLRYGGYVDPSQRLLMFRQQKLDLANFGPATRADYLWYVGERTPDTMPAGAQVIWRHGHSLLARLANPPRPD